MFTNISSMGRPLRTYGINRVEIARWCIYVTIGLVILGTARGTHWGFPPDLTLLPIALLAYALVFLWAKSKTKRITLYEYGVGVREKGNERFWRWNELTRMDGSREAFTIENIPVVKYGANHFYVGHEKAFSVSDMTESASHLVSFIHLKWAELKLPDVRTRVRRGQKMFFGNIWVDQLGIGNDKHWIEWNDVRGLHFQDGGFLNDNQWTMLVDRNSTKKAQKFSRLVMPEVFTLMGIVDDLRYTTLLADYQREYLRRPTYNLGRPGRIVLLTVLIIAILGGVIAVAAFPRWNSERLVNVGRDELVAFFGARAETICISPYLLPGSLSNPVNKYLVIHTASTSIYRPFQDVLDASETATTGEEVTAVLCVVEHPELVEECIYETGEKTRFIINRYRNDFRLYLIDVSINTAVKEGTLRAPDPAPCPENASRPDTDDIVGAPPSPDTFIEWFSDVGLRRT